MADERRPGDDPEEHEGGDPTPGGEPVNPFAAMFGQFGQGGGTGDFNAFLQQMQQALSGLGGPAGTPGFGFTMPGQAASASGVNWDQIKDVARKSVAALGPDPSPLENQRAELREAAELAESWLDGATSLPRVGGAPVCWSRAEWVEHTIPVWRRLAEPVAESTADALVEALTQGPDGAPEGGDPFAGMQEMFTPLLRSSGGTFFAMSMGQGLGKLATQVTGVTDIGLPLVNERRIVLLPANVAAFGEGLEQSPTDVRIFLTLREAARQRLFAATPWLREQIYSLVLQYAKGITIDTSAITEAMGEVDEAGFDPAAMEELSAKLQGNLLQPATSPEQRETLLSVETLLALVEGWVDEVVGQATARWMPSASALTETMRRVRASGGPAEQTFASLIGLELRPQRVRDAANLWAALRDARGAEGRDQVWRHLDLMPDAAALDDPLGYVGGESGGSDLDAELAALLDGEERPGGDGSPDRDE